MPLKLSARAYVLGYTPHNLVKPGTAFLLSVLPHRPPFVLVDSIIAGEDGCWIRTTWTLIPGDPLLTEQGTLPAPLLIEAIAQSAAVLLLSARPGAIPVLLGIDQATFCSEAVAGDVLHINAEVCWLRRRIGRARGKVVSNSGITLCEADFTFGWSCPEP